MQRSRTRTRPVLFNSRYRLVGSVVDPQARSLLDVGCRDGVLRRHVRPTVSYNGLDLVAGSSVDVVCNVEHGLPFTDGAFDAVAAVDLLEHTDRIWFVFEELIRVARLQVIVLFPNLYHWRARLRYLLGDEMDKYRLTEEPIVDRHRWLTSYRNARRISTFMARKHGLEMVEIPVLGGRRTFVVDYLLSTLSKNLGAWSVMFDLRKPTAGQD